MIDFNKKTKNECECGNTVFNVILLRIYDKGNTANILLKCTNCGKIEKIEIYDPVYEDF